MLSTEICRAAKPDAEEGWCDHILWGRTPYPFGLVTAQTLYRAASRQARAERNGRILCDFCDTIAAPGAYCCQQCDAALSVAREEADAGPTILPASTAEK